MSVRLAIRPIIPVPDPEQAQSLLDAQLLAEYRLRVKKNEALKATRKALHESGDPLARLRMELDELPDQPF
jgi:hypothetical protein